MASDEVEKQRRGAELQSSLLKRRGTQQDTGSFSSFLLSPFSFLASVVLNI